MSKPCTVCRSDSDEQAQFVLSPTTQQVKQQIITTFKLQCKVSVFHKCFHYNTNHHYQPNDIVLLDSKLVELPEKPHFASFSILFFKIANEKTPGTIIYRSTTCILTHILFIFCFCFKFKVKPKKRANADGSSAANSQFQERVYNIDTTPNVKILVRYQ